MLHSFRLKIGLLCVVLSGLLLLGFGSFALSVMNRIGLERVDRELRALADATVRKSQPPGHWARFDDEIRAMYGEDEARRFLVRVALAGGEELYASADWAATLAGLSKSPALGQAPAAEARGQDDGRREERPPKPGEDKQRRDPPRQLAVRGPVYETYTGARGEWRVMSIANSEITLSIAHNLSGLRAEVRQFRGALLVAIPLGLALVVAGGWLIGQLALRPVNLIAATAESVTATRLDARIPSAEADEEFKRLIALINAMLERLERSFKQATRFSADAAHELKTPLAVLQAQAERSLQRAPDGSAEQGACAEQLEELQRLRSILRKLLLLSQADAGALPLSCARMNLAERVRAAENDLALLAPERRAVVSAPLELFVDADGDLIDQIIGNLLSNAVKFGDQRGVIELTLEARGGWAALAVANTGEPIPQPEQPKLFERFFRADAARGREVEGSGLGLSLAREMARAHGGDLALVKSDASGTVFELRLPLGHARRPQAAAGYR
jgi:heavy metal sensor kinase